MARPARQRKAARHRGTGALREVARDAQRRVVLDAARRLVARDEAFAMRSLAEAVGASTMVLYTLFGSREQLLRVVYDEGIEQIAAALEKVEAPDPFSHVVRLAFAYRGYALAHRGFMLALLHAPGAMTRIRHGRVFKALVVAVEKCVAAGVFLPVDPAGCADLLWTTVNGFVTLDLAGYYPDEATAEQQFFLGGQTFFRGLLVSPDTTPPPQL